MKRKRNREKPSWQSLAMAGVVTLVEGWERLKSLQNQVASCPEALANLAIAKAEQTYDEALLADILDLIIPAAKAYVTASLVNPQTKMPDWRSASDAITATREILFLWECGLALNLLGDNEVKARWLSQISREQRLLITRLQNRLTTPGQEPRATN